MMIWGQKGLEVTFISQEDFSITHSLSLSLSFFYIRYLTTCIHEFPW